MEPDIIGRMNRTTKKLLVVDDDAKLRELLHRYLTEQQFEVALAGDATAMNRLIQRETFDLIILDQMLPGEDGLSIIRRLRAASDRTPIIMLTAKGDDVDRIIGLEMGADDYLPKPFNPVILAARVRASLADKRLHDVEVAHAEAQAMLLETIERQKAELSRFLSPQVAALVSSPEGEQLLAGHRREATALFCDLRGFTAFSDSAEPEEVLGVLREYHAAMGELIVEHGGTLEHFAGDGMMVFFNDPVPQPDHVERAVRMALAMRERFATLAMRWSKLGFELGFGIGMATGYATLGRIGFEGRYDYGMVGAAVIVASRLSSMAEANQILLNPRAHAAVEDIVAVEPVGELQLKGFSRPIPTVNVVGLRAGNAGVEASEAVLSHG